MPSPLPDPVPLSEIRRVLVTKLRHHGDVLLTSPVFTALARAMPEAEIDALVYRETAPMLAEPSGDRADPHDRPRLEAAGARDASSPRSGGCCGALRARRYDLLST